jgi:hypothetical protein
VVVASNSLFPREVGLDAFPAEEAHALRQLVDAFPDVDHRIMMIVQRSPDELDVWTGEQVAPLLGGGHVIYVRRQGDRWVADQERVGIWVS